MLFQIRHPSMLIEVVLQVGIALHWCYVRLMIYKLLFAFPQEKCITLMDFCKWTGSCMQFIFFYFFGESVGFG